jgi:hypothetical protein
MDQRVMHIFWMTLLAGWLAGTVAAAARDTVQLPGVIHVHSTVSSGHYSLGDLVEKARRKGIEVLIVTDHDLVAMEYGLFPLRSLIKKREERPSILASGPEKYLSEIRRLNQQQKDVVVIPGAQSSPFYYWSGSPWKKSLTAHDYRKELLLVGLQAPEDYRGLPLLHRGVSSRYFFKLLPRSLVFCTALVLGIFLWRYGRPWKPVGIGVVAVSLLLLVNHHPFQSSLYDPYHGDRGAAPYQELIDYVAERGGLTFWAHPESKYAARGTRHGKVTLMTAPYPESLLNTARYTGFAALYGDTATAEAAGKHWDQVLLEYCRGARDKPVWGVAGADFHLEKNGTEIDSFQTVFLTDRKTPAAVLRALAGGRFYAVRKNSGPRLVLEQFVVRDEIRRKSASMGEELVTADVPVVCGRVAGEDGRGHAVEVRLLRGGKLWQQFQATTPLAFRFIDPDAGNRRTYYRLEIRGRKVGRLLANPIFISRPKGRP